MNAFSLFYAACMAAFVAVLAGFTLSVINESLTIGLMVITILLTILAFLVEAKHNFKD